MNILVVSDNEVLVTFLQTKIVKKLDGKHNFTFCYSVKNSSPNRLRALGMTAVDLKNEVEVQQIIKKFNLVFSLHCKQIFPKILVESCLCINIHPGFNPFNRGWYPQVFSIINHKPIGATIHIMDNEIDHGDIIAQEEVPVTAIDTSYSLYNKVLEIEKKLLLENFENILLKKFIAYKAVDKGNYNSIQDFEKLCRLDMNHVGTFEEHIELLRALSHQNFNNAFYYSENGNKVYISINLTSE